MLAAPNYAGSSVGAPAASATVPSASNGDPPFHLGLVTYNVARDWGFDALLRILPEAGVSAVELRTTHAHGVEPSLSREQRAEVRRRAAVAGLSLLSLGSVCEFHSPDPEVVTENVRICREFVDLARDVGAKGVKVRPNGFPEGVDKEKTRSQIGRALRDCGTYAAEHGVEIWLEVHGRGTQEPENILQILRECDHRAVGANWNSNSTDVRDGSIRGAFDMLRPHLMSCHINELWGSYPYRELFSLLRASRYDRYTLCEVGSPVAAEDGLLFLRCYRGLWRELARG
jgi:sugar phosphate isomerase/epimerase